MVQGVYSVSALYCELRELPAHGFAGQLPSHKFANLGASWEDFTVQNKRALTIRTPRNVALLCATELQPGHLTEYAEE